MNMECSCSCSLVHICSCSSVLMNMEILSEKTSEINKSRLVRAFQVQISRKLNEHWMFISYSLDVFRGHQMFLNILVNINEHREPCLWIFGQILRICFPTFLIFFRASLQSLHKFGDDCRNVTIDGRTSEPPPAALAALTAAATAARGARGLVRGVGPTEPVEEAWAVDLALTVREEVGQGRRGIDQRILRAAVVTVGWRRGGRG